MDNLTQYTVYITLLYWVTLGEFKEGAFLVRRVFFIYRSVKTFNFSKKINIMSKLQHETRMGYEIK